MATCPDCDYEEIDTDDLEEGDVIECFRVEKVQRRLD